MKRLRVVWLLWLALVGVAAAQLKQIDFKTEVILERTAYAPGSTVNGVLVIQIDKPYHVNANPASEDYLIPTELKIEAGKGYNLEDNRLKVKLGATTMYEFPIVSGKGYTPRELGRGGRFATPRGILRVEKKEVDPVWYPPDWHWTERGLTPPASGRNGVRGHLGKYRLNLGQGYGIHGTTSGRIQPGKYSHGCIRMNATDLETVFKLTDVGTEVFIY